MLPVTDILPVITLADCRLPVITKLDNEPTLVMLGCAEVCSTPVIYAKLPVDPDTLPVTTLPVTDSDVNVPTAVIPGCAPVSSCPAINVADR